MTSMQRLVRRSRPAPSEASKIRVLWLIKGLGPGGAERLLTMAAGLRDRDLFEYEAAYLLEWKSHLRPDLEREGVPVHCLHGRKEWNLSWAVRLRRLLRDGRFDLVHVHSPYVASLARLVVRSLPSRTRPRVVSTEHVPWSGYARATRRLNALTFGMDDAHLAVSTTVRDSIPAKLAEGVEVVVHGVRPDALRALLPQRDQVREELGVAPDELLVGTVANYRLQKDYPTLLAAARSVLDAGHRVRFVAVGQGPEEEAIRTQHRELRLEGSFTLLGYREDAARILAGCDLFVLSSRFEGLPVALMEAVCLGLPFVGTRVPGIVDAIDDEVEGLLVPPGDPDALARAMGRVLADERLRRNFARGARARADAFDLAPAVRRTEELYRCVVEGGR